MRVFISHKGEDGPMARVVELVFKSLRVDAYLDLLDDFTGDGKRLTNHIKQRLNECTDIIVVMSTLTIKSWWVPFEIGMSAQLDMPTATFFNASIELPDYLAYWPTLNKTNDICKYVNVRKGYWYSNTLFESRSQPTGRSTDGFYQKLKSELGH